jgi:signal peptidase I
MKLDGEDKVDPAGPTLEAAAPDTDLVSNEEATQGRRDFLKAIFWCVFAVILIRTFVIEPFKIPSSSMEPTLRIGDHIFVSKFNFGWFFPFTHWQLTQWGSPQRGDTIVFLFPRDPSLHYIKRVVGLPGDKVELRGSTLSINGKEVPRERIEDPARVKALTGKQDFNGGVFEETLGSHKYYVAYNQRSMETPPSSHYHHDEVPEGTFFVMGDNRDDSYDSRSWGVVKREQVKGKAQWIWLSLDRNFQWGDWNRIRWERAFMPIP